MDLPRGRRILSEKIGNIAVAYSGIPEGFRGFIRIFMKYDGRLHNGDLLVDAGSIIGVSLDDLDKNTSVFGEEAFEEIKKKIPEAIGDVDLHTFSDTEMSLVLRTNERTLLRPGLPLEKFKEVIAAAGGEVPSGDAGKAEEEKKEAAEKEAAADKAAAEKKAAEDKAAADKKAADDKAAAEEDKRKAEEKAAAEKAAEDKKAAEEEAKKKAAADKAAAEKKAAEDKKRAEEEAKKKAAEEEAKRKAAEEAKRKADEKAAAEAKKKAEEARKVEEKKRLDAAKKEEEEWMNELGKLDDEWNKLESEWQKLDSLKGAPPGAGKPKPDSADKSAAKQPVFSKEESEVLKSKPKLVKNIGFADKLRLLRFPKASDAVKLLDGNNTVEGVASKSGADPKAVVDLVINLKNRGYIE